MASANLLTLIDDIAALLDDVAVLSKVAAKKTAGVLGDDLALNAEQVSGVRAERELPVVWAVAKGSMLNKVILVPAALIISALMPSLITVLLIIGGLYLCFEGFEKILHMLTHSKEARRAEQRRKLEALADDKIDLVKMEQDKIKGAIRTDFILSAEIIVIVLGTVQEASFVTQVAVLCALAIAITVGVYGLVAGIVKLDDAGLYLLRKSKTGRFNMLQKLSGKLLLAIAPKLMKLLSIVGTAAMFLVGGGILVHSLEWLHHGVHEFQKWMTLLIGDFAFSIGAILVEGVIGIIAGALTLAALFLTGRLKHQHP